VITLKGILSCRDLPVLGRQVNFFNIKAMPVTNSKHKNCFSQMEMDDEPCFVTDAKRKAQGRVVAMLRETHQGELCNS